MKKLIILVLVIFSLVVAMTACSSDSENTVSKKTTVTEQEESTEADTTEEETTEEEKVELTAETETESAADTSWKKLYIKFLNTLDKGNYDGYQLIYIDDDDIPELAISGMAHLIPGYICWVHDGNVRSINTTITSFKYFERENNFICRDAFTGSGSDVIHELNGSKAKEVKSGKFCTITEYEYYKWNGTAYSSLDEYEAALNADFDTNSAQSVDSTKSYTEICKEIRDY